MIKAGDKITLKREMGAFKNVGEVCEVISVKDNVISFKFGNGLHLGCMSENELDNYFTVNASVAPSVTEDVIAGIIDNAEITTNTVYGKCTIVTMKLDNGFVITESSACVSPENYNEKTGYDICMNKIISKLWELEGYCLQKKIHEETTKVDYDW